MKLSGWVAWALLTAVGGLVIALPDGGPRLVSFSRTHGPSLLDAVGIVLILLGWSVLWRTLWTYRHFMPRSRRWRVTALGVLVVAVGVCAWSITTDSGMWWAVGAAAAGLVQAVAAAAVTVSRRASGAASTRR